MATTTTTTRASLLERPGPKRKKEQRTDIWSNLLRQTREAQARSRTQAVQQCALVLCGGTPDDQRSFVQTISRPAPVQPAARNQERRQARPRGELRLSNRYAYGYGYMTLFSPPQQSGTGVQMLGAEAEEVARVEVHTVPDARDEYVGTLRRLLVPEKSEDVSGTNAEELVGGRGGDGDDEVSEMRLPGVCILLSWKEPWKFLDQLRRWMQLLAKAFLQPGQPATDPMDVLKDAGLGVTVVVQHTESQEDLFREGYKEDDFDYISQCLRTVLLPLHPRSSLIYISSNSPPQQSGPGLGEPQKVIYNLLGVDISLLSPKQLLAGESVKREELNTKHEFMDRMAIVIPAGWDSAAFVRTLSETFSPEDVLYAWQADLQPLLEKKAQPASSYGDADSSAGATQVHGAAEVFESSPYVDEQEQDYSYDSPLSPSKQLPSAVRTYESRILDPQAHRQQRAPQIDVTTKPDQKFLGEMREHLQQLEAHDRQREASASASSAPTSTGSRSAVTGLPAGEQTGALTELGDVSFNVGGVSYDTVSAEAAIERLRRIDLHHPAARPSPLSPTASGFSRSSTPKPPRPVPREVGSEDRRSAASPAVSAKEQSSSTSSAKMSASEAKDLPIDKLEEYFHSLMKKGGGGVGGASAATGSRDATPSRTAGRE